MSVSFIFPPLIVFEIPFFAMLLAELGYHVTSGVSQTHALTAQSQQFKQCSIVFATKGGVQVGVEATEEGNFNLVCNEDELANVEGISKLELKNQLTQKYTHKKVADELAKHGFTVVKEEVLEDNTIKIRVRRWN